MLHLSVCIVIITIFKNVFYIVKWGNIIPLRETEWKVGHHSTEIPLRCYIVHITVHTVIYGKQTNKQKHNKQTKKTV